MFTFKSLSVSYAAVSKVGSRERNEDSVLELEQDGQYCFVVADGLGGHSFGDKASRLLTETFAHEFKNASDNRKFLAHAFERAQEEILVMQSTMCAKDQMKTTAVALSISGKKCAWGHVGDSRLYLFYRGVLVTRTLDHSVPQMLAMAGEITDSDIANHPDRARLLRAVGDKWEKPQYEIAKEIMLRRDTAFLLCTDGVWEWLSDSMPAPQRGADAGSWLSEVINRLEHTIGEMANIDNYSAITVIIR